MLAQVNPIGPLTPQAGSGSEEINVTIENELSESEILTLVKPTELKALLHKSDKDFTIHYYIEFNTEQTYTQVNDISTWFPKSLILSLPNKTISKIYEQKNIIFGKASAGSELKPRFFITSKLNDNKIKFEFDGNGLTATNDKFFYAMGSIHGLLS